MKQALIQAKQLIKQLTSFSPEMVIASTGSCYIHLSNCKVKCIRVAGHTGHKAKVNTWQLRFDVSSSRNGNRRIYNSASRLVSDLIQLN